MDHGCHWGSSSPAWLKNVGRDRPPSNIAVCRCTSDFFLRDQLSLPQPGSGPADALTLAVELT